MANIGLNMDAYKDKKVIKRHKIADGENVYRILPPNSPDLNGVPFVYYASVWGLKTKSGKSIPYADPSCFNEDRKSPIYDFFKENEAAIKSLTESKDTPKPVKDFIENIKPKKSYMYNAVNKKGEVGLLEIKTTAHQALKKAFIKYIQDFAQDPTSLSSTDEDSGVWFCFTREGTGRDTEYKVDVNMVKVKQNGRILMDFDRGPDAALPQSVLDNWESQAYNLKEDCFIKKTYGEFTTLFLVTLVDAVNDPVKQPYLKDLTITGKPLGSLVVKVGTVQIPEETRPEPVKSTKANIGLNVEALSGVDMSEIDGIV